MSNDNTTTKKSKKNNNDTEPKKTPHLSKVEKFKAGLPQMNDTVENIFVEARELTSAELGILISHLQAETRIRGVNGSAGIKGHEVGQIVRVISGTPKFIGREGTVTKSQRIRCYVAFADSDKEGYFFHSDLEALDQEDSEINSDEEESETLVEVPVSEVASDSSQENDTDVDEDLAATG